MHGVRRVANQRQALVDGAFGELQRQWIAPLRPDDLKGAQKFAEAALQFGDKIFFVKRHDCRRQVGPFGPDDGRTVPRTVQVSHKRQDGERTGGQEVFVGGEVVATFVGHRTNDGGLFVGPVGDPDSSSLAGPRIAPVGGNGQAGLDFSPVAQVRRYPCPLAGKQPYRSRSQEPDRIKFPDAVEKRLSEVAVFDHETERLLAGFAVVVVEEKQGAALGHADFLDRRSIGLQRRPNPEARQHPLGCQRDRRRPAVETGVEPGPGVLGIDDDNIHPGLGKGDGQGRAHQSTADDQHFRLEKAWVRRGRRFRR